MKMSRRMMRRICWWCTRWQASAWSSFAYVFALSASLGKKEPSKVKLAWNSCLSQQIDSLSETKKLMELGPREWIIHQKLHRPVLKELHNNRNNNNLRKKKKESIWLRVARNYLLSRPWIRWRESRVVLVRGWARLERAKSNREAITSRVRLIVLSQNKQFN